MIEIDTVKAIPSIYYSPEIWTIVPLSTAKELSKSYGFHMYRIKNPPPNRIYYLAKLKNPGPATMKGLSIFEKSASKVIEHLSSILTKEGLQYLDKQD
ncbi:hypothetical protein [Lysinibacillus pakistanensis]|uniref:hypothetical protein n=1 Tax=Lysinibacillus pakistanensis TaxID=759811 RepID=UPI003D273B60